jgi:hypothetical protein
MGLRCGVASVSVGAARLFRQAQLSFEVGSVGAM